MQAPRSDRQIDIRPVAFPTDWAAFIELPWSIYKNDPNWVPPLRMAVRDLLDVNKNPFFKHAIMRPILAFRGEECVGRLVAVIDEAHNQFHGEKVGFFGFFECIDDQGVADRLLTEAALWVKGKGATLLRGPVNLSTNHEVGLLVEGFDDAPFVMMTYNPPYYIQLFERWGLTKAKDLFAYTIDSRTARFSERLQAQAERLRQGSAVSFRPVNIKKFENEVDQILAIYNDAWEKNWGFVPMTPEEFRHMAKDMKMILDPELLLIAEVRGEMAGFVLALPDVNQVFKKVHDGRLFPTGLFKLLWNLKGPGRRRTVTRCRVLTLGIKREFREIAIGPLLYSETLKRGRTQGYAVGECSWILEDNRPMNRALEHMCGKRTKVYRIYDKVLVD